MTIRIFLFLKLTSFTCSQVLCLKFASQQFLIMSPVENKTLNFVCREIIDIFKCLMLYFALLVVIQTFKF